MENRRWWPFAYTGPLLLHAGKSRDWMRLSSSGAFEEQYGLPVGDMAFGALVGIVELAGMFRTNTRALSLVGRIPPAARTRWPWLTSHEHAEGPHCLVLENIRRFVEPIPCRGMQGLFDVPDELVAAAIAAAVTVDG